MLIVHYNPYDWIRLHEAGHDVKYEADSFQQTGTFWFICSSLLGQGRCANTDYRLLIIEINTTSNNYVKSNKLVKNNSL